MNRRFRPGINAAAMFLILITVCTTGKADSFSLTPKVFHNDNVSEVTASLTLRTFEIVNPSECSAVFSPKLDGLALQGSPTGAVTTPEPTTMILLGTGLLGIGAAMRKRRRQE